MGMHPFVGSVCLITPKLVTFSLCCQLQIKDGSFQEPKNLEIPRLINIPSYEIRTKAFHSVHMQLICLKIISCTLISIL